MFFSVVIPTLDEEDFLPFLLKDLAGQNFKNFQVIVVDASSEDNTVKKAGEFKDKLKLVSFIVERKNVAFQRNFGVKKARGRWILFMDADNRIPKHFLKKLRKTIKRKKEVDIFSCLIDTKKYKKKNYKLIMKCFNNALRLSEKLSPQAPGSMIGIKKELAGKFCFDEKKVSAEDRFFIDEICKNGYKYKLFSEPRYKFSMRRFDKEGPSLLLKYCYNTLRYLSGDDFCSNNDFYPMKGGKYYKRAGK